MKENTIIHSDFQAHNSQDKYDIRKGKENKIKLSKKVTSFITTANNLGKSELFL